jgi:hypothetical protein
MTTQVSLSVIYECKEINCPLCIRIAELDLGLGLQQETPTAHASNPAGGRYSYGERL